MRPVGARELEAQRQQVVDGAVGREHPPSLEALVQQVTVTDDAGATVADHAREIGLTEDELLRASFMLVGTEDEMIAAIAERERRWGITRYVVREDALDVAAALMRRLP